MQGVCVSAHAAAIATVQAPAMCHRAIATVQALAMCQCQKLSRAGVHTAWAARRAFRLLAWVVGRTACLGTDLQLPSIRAAAFQFGAQTEILPERFCRMCSKRKDLPAPASPVMKRFIPSLTNWSASRWYESSLSSLMQRNCFGGLQPMHHPTPLQPMHISNEILIQRTYGKHSRLSPIAEDCLLESEPAECRSPLVNLDPPAGIMWLAIC